MENLKDLIKTSDDFEVKKLQQILSKDNVKKMWEEGKIKLVGDNPLFSIFESVAFISFYIKQYEYNQISKERLQFLLKLNIEALFSVFEVDITENKPCDRACPFLSYAYCSKYDKQLEHIDEETFFKTEECK